MRDAFILDTLAYIDAMGHFLRGDVSTVRGEAQWGAAFSFSEKAGRSGPRSARGGIVPVEKFGLMFVDEPAGDVDEFDVCFL